MKLELGNTLIELCKTVPSGVVVFFTSYKQEAAFYDLWQKNGLLQKLEAQKTIFREPKKTSDVDELLEKYGRSVRTRGAILFAVVGGKVSEGINFTGELCRAVIMIGLPFPDIKSVELRAGFKMTIWRYAFRALESGGARVLRRSFVKLLLVKEWPG